MATRIANALAAFSTFRNVFNDDAYNENRPVRRSGRRRDESDAPGAERGRKVEPKAVRNKGISRIETTKRRCERPPSVDAKQSASRDNRGDARDGRKRQPNSTDRKQSRRRRSTRTAEPRVERRSNRKSRSRSPPPVPTRVSTIKYLAAKPTLRRRKFYATSPIFPKRALSLFVRLRFFSPNHPIVRALTTLRQRNHPIFPILTSLQSYGGAENLFEKI